MSAQVFSKFLPTSSPLAACAHTNLFNHAVHQKASMSESAVVNIDLKRDFIVQLIQTDSSMMSYFPHDLRALEVKDLM